MPNFLHEAIARYRQLAEPGDASRPAARWNVAALDYLLKRLTPREQAQYYQQISTLRDANRSANLGESNGR